MNETILTLNGGSSSIRFALFEIKTMTKILEGKADRIGMDGTYLCLNDIRTKTETKELIDKQQIMRRIGEVLNAHIANDTLVGIGHRVVHGGARFSRPTLIDDDMIGELEKLSPFAPRHLPTEIALIRLCRDLFPDVPQLGCFDTGFFSALPRVAQMLSIPRKYEEHGIRRYGFHGLSYEYLMQYLKEVVLLDVQHRKIVLVHLGNGVSLAAVANGAPVDTTMGFTPASGVPMGTRSGDIDPGLIEYFTRVLGFTAEDFDHMVNAESGLKGVSGITADMEVLINEAPDSTPATEAISYFCYHIRKSIGSLAAAMGGIDVLVFTGGMGEKSSLIRERICSELGFLGIEIDNTSNETHSLCISTQQSRVAIYMIPTNEELVLARTVLAGSADKLNQTNIH